MLYLDMHPFLGMPTKFDHAWSNLIHTREEQYADEMRGYLDELAQAHFFFEITRLEWYDRLRRAAEIGYADKDGIDILELLPRKRVTHIPSEIFELQRRGLTLIEAVMDIGRKAESFQKRLADYYTRNAKDGHLPPFMEENARVDDAYRFSKKSQLPKQKTPKKQCQRAQGAGCHHDVARQRRVAVHLLGHGERGRGGGGAAHGD